LTTVPLEVILADQPGSAGGGSRPPRRRWRRWDDAAERAGLRWAALVWVLVLAALLVQDPGRMTFDTKLGVNIDPVGFYERLWHLWNPLEYLGSLQDQYIGYAFPMGAFYLTAHVLHVPVWVAERLWMSLLIAVGFLGLVRLAEALGIGNRPTRLLAGAARAVADVHDPGLARRRAAGAAGALGRPAAGPHRATRAGGGAVRPRRGLHGRHQRGLHPRRACAARNVRADPAGPPPLGACGLVGAGGRAGHGLVGGAAAVPGPLRVQLPAVHRAGDHHHCDHVSGDGAARQR
jgi:hypothetical protein